MSLHEYKIRIEKAVRKMDGTPIFNGTIAHASALAEAIFASATDHVWILSGSLNARVYGPEEVVEQAKLFLAHPKHKMQVLMEDNDPEICKGHPFFETLGDMANLEVRQVPEQIQKLYDFHFMTADGLSYRFEEDKEQCAATAAFGDKSGAINLEHLYQKLWNASKKLDS